MLYVKNSFNKETNTYARSFLRALSAFSLWMCSIRMRLFLKTLPLALRYRLWYLKELRWVKWSTRIRINVCRSAHNYLRKSENDSEPRKPTCACRFFWPPCSDATDDAGSSCVASSTASQAYGRWLYPFSFLDTQIKHINYFFLNLYFPLFPSKNK